MALPWGKCPSVDQPFFALQHPLNLRFPFLPSVYDNVAHSSGVLAPPALTIVIYSFKGGRAIAFRTWAKMYVLVTVVMRLPPLLEFFSLGFCRLVPL